MAARRKLFVQQGQRFGRGTVIDPEIKVGVRKAKPNGERGAGLRCDCGNQYAARLSHLFAGAIQSCGCVLQEWASELAHQYGPSVGQPVAAAASVTHGLTSHELYNTWNQMLRRCEDPRNHRYDRYGGRGIKVCERWYDVGQFVADIENELGPRPDGMTLDRLNNDGDYAPGNVRWASRSEQRINQAARQRAIDYTDHPPTLEDVQKWPAAVSVARASAALGLSRSHGYALARSGRFPVRTIEATGPRIVDTADLIRVLTSRKGK